MIKYLQKVKHLASTLRSFEIQQISREENSQADLLSKLVTSMPIDLSKGAYVEVVKKLIIEELAKVMQLDGEPSWIDPLINFLKHEMLLVDQKEAS